MDILDWLDAVNEFHDDIPEELYDRYVMTIQVVCSIHELEIELEY